MISDEQLARQIQAGQRDALGSLLERHASPLLGYLIRMTEGDKVFAEDLLQETFTRVLRGIHGYDVRRPFKAWLYRIATNLLRDHARSADRRRTHAMPDDAEGRFSADAPAAEEATIAQQEAAAVIAALGQLPKHQREVVVLRYYQDLSLAEIAEALGIPLGTVKSRLSLGLGRLRALLQEG